MAGVGELARFSAIEKKDLIFTFLTPKLPTQDAKAVTAHVYI
jgi:hypothetical protein